MDIENSSLYLEVKRITQGGAKPVHYYWKAQIHFNGETLDAIKMVSSDSLMDWELNYTDEMTVELLLEQGKFLKRVYPHRNNLEITIIRKPVQELTDSTNEQANVKSERYTAVMIDQGNPFLRNDDGTVPSEEVLDLSNLISLNFQLIPKALNLLRMISVGGPYRATTPETLIKTLLTRESTALDIDQEFLPLGVDMVPANNKTQRDHIVIKHGTKLVELPQFIQDHAGGLYSAGLGFYYYQRMWYLFPLYDTERFEQSNRQVTIINISGNKFPSTERSYRLDGGNLVILATGEVNFNDISDHQQMNLGNGARFADASVFVEDFVKTSGNKTIANRGQSVNEVQTVARASGNQNVHVSDRKINANVFREYSDLARRDGSLVTLLWENANLDLVKPGMMAKILYMENDQIRTAMGVLLKAQAYTEAMGKVVFASRHRTNLVMAFFINRKTIQN